MKLNQKNRRRRTIQKQKLRRRHQRKIVLKSNFHLNDSEKRFLRTVLYQSGSKISDKIVKDLSATLSEEKPQRNDLFSLLIKIVLSASFGLVAFFLGASIILGWQKLWVGGLQNFGVIILLSYCVTFVVIAIDIWREKDRNYLISIFSCLVALSAFLLTLFRQS